MRLIFSLVAILLAASVSAAPSKPSVADQIRHPQGQQMASVPILKSVSFYAFAARVRRQKRWMLARMSLAVLVQRKGFGSALVASM